MRFRKYGPLFLLGAFLLPLFNPAQCAAANPQYLLFNLFVGAPGPPGGDGIYRRELPKEALLGIVQHIAATVRPERTNPDRILGFTVGPIAMDQGADDARSVIRDAFDIALQTNMAVALHLDDYMFTKQARWSDGRLLHADPATEEWTDWSRTPAKSTWVGWLPGVPLAPQLCYESPQVTQFVTYWTRDVIGREVRRQFDRLVQAGKPQLFAGVFTGWESNMDFGYCSLSHHGFSAQHPPADFNHERELVLQRHVERWAKGIYDAGIPRDRIFTHVAPLSQRESEEILRHFEGSPHMPTPPRNWMAFNNYSNPGFSVYITPPGIEHFNNIYDALREYGGNTWAMAEGSNAIPTGPRESITSSLSWERYLGRILNHGGKIANVFAGFQGESGALERATESEEALAAYRKFLRGEQLVEGN